VLLRVNRRVLPWLICFVEVSRIEVLKCGGDAGNKMKAALPKGIGNARRQSSPGPFAPIRKS
jgi:hypothetical protein